MVKLATWNVNSIKARLPNVLAWLEEASPDVVLLQELKCQEDSFPVLEFEERGYNCLVRGQKSYNGVGILSRDKLDAPLTDLPGDDGSDGQARYLEATTFGLRVASIYLPNGNPLNSEKFPYKLRWMQRLLSHTGKLLEREQPIVLGGDYNVIPEDRDCYNVEAWKDDALFQPESRAALRRIVHGGYTDAYRALHPDRERAFTYWDYQRGAWNADHGIRIDHLLLSPQAADRLEGCDIDTGPRGQSKASDHTPIWCEIAA